MRLIIAEKASLARNIVAGIGTMSKKNGYYENNAYIVTWAFGHLYTLYDIEEYTGDTNTKWVMDNLPYYPNEFKFHLKKDDKKQIDTGVLKQANLISALCNRDDVDTIINAGDSDREGEIIVRLCIYNALKTKKVILRLWLPDQTPETVKQALIEMKEDKEYDNLANEGFARTYIDWLYGVNLTRYATLKTGMLLRVGRVIVPIVKAIYDRDMAIKNFVEDIYYGLFSNELTKDEAVELNSKEKFDKKDKNDALKLVDKYNSVEAFVTDKKVKKDVLNPGKLYSLTNLQNFLGKKYKMSMDKSLAIVQKLYENGYLTYPRTNSEYLATNEKDKIKKIIDIVAGKGYPVKFKDKKTIFDDSKIESHSALTPTYKMPSKTDLIPEEVIVYSTVLRRFVALFCNEECNIEKTEIKIKLGDLEEFTLKGTVIIDQGWTKYDEYNKNDKVLPNLNIGDKKNRDDDTDDYKAIFEGLELGTEATRTGIIENAKRSNYIELKKDVYYILPDGIFLVESLSYMNIIMDKYKTSELGKGLKSVFHNKMEIKDVVKLTEDEISDVFKKQDVKTEDDTDNGFYGDKVGICPLCGKDVVKNRYGYGCTGYKDGCKFRINGVICKRVISNTNAALILKDGVSSKINGFISKNNKEFSAKLRLKDGNITFDFN